MKPMKWKDMSRARKRIIVFGVIGILFQIFAMGSLIFVLKRPFLLDVGIMAFVGLSILVAGLTLKYLLFFEDKKD